MEEAIIITDDTISQSGEIFRLIEMKETGEQTITPYLYVEHKYEMDGQLLSTQYENLCCPFNNTPCSLSCAAWKTEWVKEKNAKIGRYRYVAQCEFLKDEVVDMYSSAVKDYASAERISVQLREKYPTGTVLTINEGSADARKAFVDTVVTVVEWIFNDVTGTIILVCKTQDGKERAILSPCIRKLETRTEKGISE